MKKHRYIYIKIVRYANFILQNETHFYGNIETLLRVWLLLVSVIFKTNTPDVIWWKFWLLSQSWNASHVYNTCSLFKWFKKISPRILPFLRFVSFRFEFWFSRDSVQYRKLLSFFFLVCYRFVCDEWLEPAMGRETKVKLIRHKAGNYVSFLNLVRWKLTLDTMMVSVLVFLNWPRARVCVYVYVCIRSRVSSLDWMHIYICSSVFHII